MLFIFFFFNDTATTEIYTLSLHDALPIFRIAGCMASQPGAPVTDVWSVYLASDDAQKTLDAAEAEGGQVHVERSEEHTSELQSLRHLVCRLLLEKKKHIQR